MKIKNLPLLFVCCFLFSSVKAQEIAIVPINIIRIHCDSLGYITNLKYKPDPCAFYFLENEKVPGTFFYRPNLSQTEFYDFQLRDDFSKISEAKLVTRDYVPAVRDFIYCITENNDVLYYYIINDAHKQKQSDSGRYFSSLKITQ